MSFSLFRKRDRDKVENKARIEYKLYLARENPEPVFDLSECNLKEVPTGIYSLCKVFRKERLSLQFNQLTSLSGGGQLADLSLLTVLELHHNNLSTLSEHISLLNKLQELNVSHNKLRFLPGGVGLLRDLRLLYCAHNRLCELPSTVGGLVALEQLDVRNNPNLQTLPSALAGATQLQVIHADPDTVQHPPSSILTQGTVAILRYLCNENGTSFVPNDTSCQLDCSPASEKLQPQGTFNLLEKKKEDKLNQLKEVEKMLQEKKNKEFELHEITKEDKSKLLLKLLQQEKQFKDNITLIQAQKEQERARLLNYLIKVEKQADESISDLLAISQAVQNNVSLWQEQELQKHHTLHDLKANSVKLQHERVLDAMGALLCEERARKEKFLAYEKTREEVIQSSLLREVEWSQQVSDLVQERDNRQSEMVSAIHTDMQLQKALVARLLERSDLRTQSLLLQTSLVQHQLKMLTVAELHSKRQNTAYHMIELEEKRQKLSEILVELLNQQEARQAHLVDTLHQLENGFDETQVCEDKRDYWLWQYQYLIDNNLPASTSSSLDPELVHQLVTAGVAHCLPYLTCCPLTSITADILVQAGVKDKGDQETILHVIKTYLKQNDNQFMPSAPPDESPSAPQLPQSPTLPECVVCMEHECAVVFVPCGHLCSCSGCAAQLLLCPLCRSPLDRKIHIIIP